MTNNNLEDFLDLNTDHYFKKTTHIILKNKDIPVTYAVFMRRPVLVCPSIALKWLKQVEKIRNTKFDIEMCYNEGDWVGAGEPLMFLSGKFSKLVELETTYLQLIGPASVAAYNAYKMSADLPNTKFMAMDARHCAGAEMHELMAYGSDLASEIKDTDNPEQVLRNPEAHKDDLPSYARYRQVFEPNSKEIKQLLKYTADYYNG